MIASRHSDIILAASCGASDEFAAEGCPPLIVSLSCLGCRACLAEQVVRSRWPRLAATPAGASGGGATDESIAYVLEGRDLVLYLRFHEGWTATTIGCHGCTCMGPVWMCARPWFMGMGMGMGMGMHDDDRLSWIRA